MKTNTQRVYIKIGKNTYYTSQLFPFWEMNALRLRKNPTIK